MNGSDPWGLEKVRLIQSEGGPAGLTGSHVTIEVEWHDDKGMLHSCYWGFYPQKPADMCSSQSTGPGAVVETHKKPTGKVSNPVSITRGDVKKLRGAFIGPHPLYDAQEYNCADWARDKLSSIMPGFSRNTQSVETPKSLFNQFNGAAEGPEGQ